MVRDCMGGKVGGGGVVEREMHVTLLFIGATTVSGEKSQFLAKNLKFLVKNLRFLAKKPSLFW